MGAAIENPNGNYKYGFTLLNKKAASRGGFKLLIQEAPQLTASAWMLELAQSFRFNLTNTFTCHAELLTNLFECVVCVHADTKAHTPVSYTHLTLPTILLV